MTEDEKKAEDIDEQEGRSRLADRKDDIQEKADRIEAEINALAGKAEDERVQEASKEENKAPDVPAAAQEPAVEEGLKGLSAEDRQRIEDAKKQTEAQIVRQIQFFQQLAELAKKIPALPNEKKAAFLPPVGMPFKLNNFFFFAVSYQNVGKMRISCDYLGMTPNPDPPGTSFKDSKEIVILKDGRQLNRQDFERWRRENYPTEAERGRNPDNVTLGVQSGVLGGGAKFKKPGS